MEGFVAGLKGEDRGEHEGSCAVRSGPLTNNAQPTAALESASLRRA
jgi:hypothetical protein